MSVPLRAVYLSGVPAAATVPQLPPIAPARSWRGDERPKSSSLTAPSARLPWVAALIPSAAAFGAHFVIVGRTLAPRLLPVPEPCSSDAAVASVIDARAKLAQLIARAASFLRLDA